MSMYAASWSRPPGTTVNKFIRRDKGKHRHVAITAVARELCAFIWAVLMAVPEH
jgi:hypothetical protein